MTDRRDTDLLLLLFILVFVLCWFCVGVVRGAIRLHPGATGDEAGTVTCQEDEAAVVAPGERDGLNWVCVVLDDWADADSIARLDAILADRLSRESALRAR